MTSTRPQGERVHTPHPDVTIVTTTSTLLLGPKTPVEADETSVKEHLAKKDEAEGVQPLGISRTRSRLIQLKADGAIYD